MTVYAQNVARAGLGTSHVILLDEVPAGSRVLDVGCAEGYLARELRERRCTVVGLEYDESAAQAAREFCEEVVTGDVESGEVRARVDGPYDRILFGDVLEHLRDPAPVLRWARDLLGPEGRAVVSLPNIANWSARREVARGRFPYADHGLFDRTHLRFFTRRSARELVTGCGLDVERERFASGPLPLERRFPWLGHARPLFIRSSPELFALQVVLTCRPRTR
jgi:methionine biosynthesis protein MetW